MFWQQPTEEDEAQHLLQPNEDDENSPQNQSLLRDQSYQLLNDLQRLQQKIENEGVAYLQNSQYQHEYEAVSRGTRAIVGKLTRHRATAIFNNEALVRRLRTALESLDHSRNKALLSNQSSNNNNDSHGHHRPTRTTTTTSTVDHHHHHHLLGPSARKKVEQNTDLLNSSSKTLHDIRASLQETHETGLDSLQTLDMQGEALYRTRRYAIQTDSTMQQASARLGKMRCRATKNRILLCASLVLLLACVLCLFYFVVLHDHQLILAHQVNVDHRLLRHPTRRPLH